MKPEKWKNMSDPVVPLRKALYGMSRSGYTFGKLTDGAYLEFGWDQLKDIDPSVFTKRQSNVAMASYVDDIVCAGESKELQNEMNRLRKRFKVPVTKEPADRTTVKFLGFFISEMPLAPDEVGRKRKSAILIFS